MASLMATQKDAAAAVSALFFVTFVMAVFNVRYTGFKLYIPVAAAALIRGLSSATRAAYFASNQPQYFAASRAFIFVGLGISIAMCSCFLVIWLRNAKSRHLPASAARLTTVLCKVLIAAVIICGPMLGIAAVGVLYANPGDVNLTYHGMMIRKASSAGFLAVEGTIAILILFVSLNWLIKFLRTPTNTQQQQQQQADIISKQQQLRTDGLIFVLLSTNLLLLWAVAALVSSLDHPNVITDPNIHYPVEVLPSLLQAIIWSWPALVAKIAIGGSYPEWQRQQQQGSKATKDPEKSSPGASEESAVESSVADDPVDLKVIQLAEQQQQQQ